MKGIKDLRDEALGLSDKIEAICELVEKEARELTAAEQKEIDSLLARKEEIVEGELPRARALEENRKIAMARFDELQAQRDDLGEREFLDGAGNKVRMVASNKTLAPPKESLRGLANEVRSTPHALGEVVKGIAKGSYAGAPAAIKAAMKENSGSAGGYTIGSEIIAPVIDLARARSAYVQSGATTVSMPAPETSMVRLIQDVTLETKGELETLSTSDMRFGKLTLVAHKIGTIFKVSRELAYDAPNFAQMVENFAASALAAKVDSYAIQGSGSGEPLGILNNTELAETGSVGAIEWEDLASAAAQVRLANHMPNAGILGVQANEDLMVLAAGDGTNSAKSWLGRPPALEGVTLNATNNCPLAQAIVGDFSHALFGVREEVRLEVSPDVGFEEDSLYFKIVWRGDFGVTDPTAFHRLAGITS